MAMVEPGTLAIFAAVVIAVAGVIVTWAGWCRCRRFRMSTWFAAVVTGVTWNWAWALATIFMAAGGWLVPCRHVGRRKVVEE